MGDRMAISSYRFLPSVDFDHRDPPIFFPLSLSLSLSDASVHNDILNVLLLRRRRRFEQLSIPLLSMRREERNETFIHAHTHDVRHCGHVYRGL